MSYYNTLNESGEALRQSTVKAKTQTEKVLDHFRKYPSGYQSPSGVHRSLGLNCPITSIRRAMTDLTSEGKLEKTSIKEKGIYGKPEYCWRLKTQEGQTTLF